MTGPPERRTLRYGRMVADLVSLLEPAHTAVVTMEMQRGVVGDLASIPELSDAAAEQDLITNVAAVCATARRVGIRVVHATVSWRADRAGTPLSTPLMASLARNPAQILDGSQAAELVPELDRHPADLRSHRHHGLTPFTGTDLDMLLRSLGVRTVVATGVSLNIGVLGLCLSATDLGYRVVMPSEAVCGTPAHFVAELLHHTIRPIATVTTVAAVLDAWESQLLGNP